MYKFNKEFDLRPAAVKGTKIVVSREGVDFIEEFVSLMNNGYIPVVLNKNSSVEEKEKIAAATSVMDPRFTYGNYFIMCTSGTTGYTKLVVHSYNNILATGKQYSKILNSKESDVFFSAAKMFHAYGLGNSFSIPQASRAQVVFCNDIITPKLACNLIDKNNVTVFCGVPRHYASFVNTKTYPSNGSLRICISAGEKLPVNIKAEFEKNTGVEIIDAIGSTETLGFMLSSGQPVPGVDLKLDGEELLVKSPSMFLGYYNEVSRNTEGRWFRTGDLYELQQGHYVHKGRANDLVKINGSKIYINIVEQEILALPGVQECALTTFKNPLGLEKLKLHLVCNNYLDIRQKISELGTAHRITFLTELTHELPRTPSGKIKKYTL